jgi:hypothetical protein
MQLQEAYKQHVAQGGQLTFEEFVEVVMTQNQNRQQAASGGIMGAPRQGYFFGKLVRKIKDDIIPNELKNPLGLAATAVAANYAPKIIPGIDLGGENQTLLQRFLPSVSGALQTAREKAGNVLLGEKTSTKNPETDTIETTRDGGVLSGIASALLENPASFLIPAAGVISGAFAKEDDPGYTGQGTGLNLRDIGRIANISDEKVGQAAGLRFLPQLSARKYTPEEMIETYAATEAEDFSTPETKAQGGRIGYEEGGMMGSQEDFNEFLEEMKKRDFGRMQEQILRDYENYMKRKKMINQMPEAKDGGIMKMADGGMMDMGGMEMDLRGGGFVPIGEQEKADDVPARLSQNEFVFTADAVRGAGGGDVDKGADKMYKTMKELEGMVV